MPSDIESGFEPEFSAGQHVLTDDIDTDFEVDEVLLSSGESLDVASVDEFLRWRHATFVSIVGETGAGKTTLIYSIYDSFRRGPFAGFRFTGSRTLMAFERQAHFSRVASGRTTPDTRRTSRDEGLRFFHLGVSGPDSSPIRKDLMISDRAGEFYKQARSNSEGIASLIEVAKADFVVFLLDGARISEVERRAGAFQAVRQTLRALLDGGVLNEMSKVQVVTTKIDLVEGSPRRSEIINQISMFQDRLSSDFTSRLSQLSFFSTAAHATDSNFPFAHGVDALLCSWLEPAPKTVIRSNDNALHLTTEFDRLLVRTSFELES